MCAPVDILQDGSFELGPFGGAWIESSTNFGTPVCDVAGCGLGGGTGPAPGGTFWAWFGGSDFLIEDASVTQALTINPGPAMLNFLFELPACDTLFDFFTVRIDGNLLFARDGSSVECGQVGYVPYSIDVSAWADGNVHTIEFYGHTEAFLFTATNFMVDNVQLVACP